MIHFSFTVLALFKAGRTVYEKKFRLSNSKGPRLENFFSFMVTIFVTLFNEDILELESSVFSIDNAILFN